MSTKAQRKASRKAKRQKERDKRQAERRAAAALAAWKAKIFGTMTILSSRSLPVNADGSFEIPQVPLYKKDAA